MSRRFIITLVTLIVIGTAAGIAIFLAKGYTFSPKEGRVVGTGIISITSKPDAASVYVDGHLTTATNATISSLPPKKYTVRVVKEGFIPWQKDVEVKEGLVTDLKVTLYPAIPSLYPLTYNGIKNPILSPDGSKLAYIVPVSTESAQLRKKAGVWVWSMESDRPIAFARGAEPHQIAASDLVNYDNASLRWSSDSKQVLATVENNNYLLDQNNLNSNPKDITPVLETTLKTWEEDNLAKERARVLNIKDLTARKIASNSAVLRWSPDETKFMYSEKVSNVSKASDTSDTSATSRLDETNINLKVYDLETGKQYDIPPSKYHFWLPDSEHVVMVEPNQISILDFDGTNKAVVFAGNFEDSLVFAWPDSSRLILISSFPTPTASVPNLYGINLK